MAAPVTIEIHKGEDYEDQYQWCLADGATPVKLNGYTGIWRIRKTTQHTGHYVYKDVTILDANNGVYQLDLTVQESLNIPSTGNSYNQYDEYVYDVIFTNTNNGKTYIVQSGAAYIYPY